MLMLVTEDWGTGEHDVYFECVGEKDRYGNAIQSEGELLLRFNEDDLRDKKLWLVKVLKTREITEKVTDFTKEE